MGVVVGQQNVCEDCSIAVLLNRGFVLISIASD